jgi:hypothetical protein
MPIRINLLAEAQIAEDLRRRDPVKRAIFAGAFLVVLALVWSSSLQLAVMISKSDLAQVQSQIDAHTDQWQSVLVNQRKVFETRAKLASLQQLTDARFLQGNFMNALQQVNLDGVQLIRAGVEQTYLKVEGVANQTNNGHVVLGHPAAKSEKIVITLDARDFSANPGDQVNKFKEVVADQPYFKSILSKTNSVQLVSLSPPQNGTDGKPYVVFTLECDLPQQNR